MLQSREGEGYGFAAIVFAFPLFSCINAILWLCNLSLYRLYALEVEYDFKVGDEIFHLNRGGSVYAPKLIPHTLHDVSDTGSELLVVAQPAGHIEAFSVVCSN